MRPFITVIYSAFLILTIAILFLNFSAHADSNDLSNSNENQSYIIAFTSKSRASSEICKYVDGQKPEGYGLPDIFSNVRNIIYLIL